MGGASRLGGGNIRPGMPPIGGLSGGGGGGMGGRPPVRPPGGGFFGAAARGMAAGLPAPQAQQGMAGNTNSAMRVGALAF